VENEGKGGRGKGASIFSMAAKGGLSPRARRGPHKREGRKINREEKKLLYIRCLKGKITLKNEKDVVPGERGRAF